MSKSRKIKYTNRKLKTQDSKLAIECGHAAASVVYIIKLGLGDARLNVLAGLDQAPHRPHGMRRRAPCADSLLQCNKLTLARGGGQVSKGGHVRWCCAVLEVSGEERASFGVVRVARRVKHVRCWAVVVGCPLVEVVRDVEGGWVWGRVLKVDENDLLTVTRRKKKRSDTPSRGDKRKVGEGQTRWCSGVPSFTLLRRSMFP